MVGSFYDPELDEGCAFEELISFHGGLGGPQTRPFVLHPRTLPVPDEPLVGAAAVHGLLLGWREGLQGPTPGPDALVAAPEAEPAPGACGPPPCLTRASTLAADGPGRPRSLQVR